MLPVSIIPTHKIASWLITHIDSLLNHLGISQDKNLEELVYFIIILAFSILLAWGIKRIVLVLLRKAIAIRKTEFATEILREHTIAKCSHILPPLIFIGLIPFAFNYDTPTLTLLMRCMGVYALIALAIGINAVLTLIFNRYNKHENTRNLPIKGILNIGIGIVWIIITILCFSVLLGKSPTALLAGLTAFAAALMLIFKDSILGFVAGIQMSQNDMLRVGDWIVVPSTIANGIVLDVSLSVVKIQNWDNTIVMVPPYTLVSTSFQNYRGMQDSGMRRICRSYLIDITTVIPADETFVNNLVEKVPDIKDFVDKLRTSGQTLSADPGLRPLNGSLETNLGLFRAYITKYLSDSPEINSTGRILVRTMDPEEAGIPLQIWCFTSTTNFNAYEAIQSALFEHLAAMAPVFSLAIYAAGTETIDGTLSTTSGTMPAQTSASKPA